MKREERYLVVKYKDMVNYLTEDDQVALIELAKKVDKRRQDDGKQTIQCVVVEHDWPEYEDVWAMIASRVDNVPFFKAKLGIDTHLTTNPNQTEETK